MWTMAKSPPKTKLKIPKGKAVTEKLTEKALATSRRQLTEAQTLRAGERKCIAKRAGKDAMCGKSAIRGGLVCATHGGSAPQVKAAAEKRFRELVEPAIERLSELAAQDEHRPTAHKAVETIFKYGLPDPHMDKGNTGGPTIRIGIALGGLATKDQPGLIAAVCETAVEAEIVHVDAAQ